jgi:hypothetical protein
MWLIVKITFHLTYLYHSKNLMPWGRDVAGRVGGLETAKSGLSHPSGTTLVLF